MPTPADRLQQATIFAAEHRWQPTIIEGAEFDLMAFTPANLSADVLTIYIEGDGLAWITNEVPSTDPTPINFLGLRLAVAQPEGMSAYLARPCQYVSDQHAHHCVKSFWTDARFSEQVVNAMNQAIRVLKQRSQAQRLILIGYSGGGAIAALIAARRDDVKQLVTVAGNLDTVVWSSKHNFLPLSQSLNPIDYVQRLKLIPQWHLVGLNDAVVSPEIVESYVAKINSTSLQIRRFENYDHICCWADNWSQIWRDFSASQIEK